MKSALIVLVSLVTFQFAQAASPWLQAQSPFAIQKILENSTAPRALPGAIIASPSTSNPNYYYYWVRDGALVMGSVVSLWQATKNSETRELYEQLVRNYVTFSRQNQTAKTLTGLGEPKFKVDGTGYTGNWGRPQNDGPALRSITLVRVANTMLARGTNETREYVTRELYDSQSPSASIIKTDLDYVAQNWQKPCFDIWEESKGTHFYTLMVQRKALIWGAELAARLGDQQSSIYYRKTASAIAAFLPKFWDSKRNIIVPTLGQTTGTRKPAGLDIAIVLGALHGGLGDGYFDVYDSRVESTLKAIEVAFKDLYAINKLGHPGVAIGRYPEDLYDGTNKRGSIGHAWVLTTLAAAEFHYLRGEHSSGDSYAERISYHVGADGSLAEQFNRDTGVMMSARDLTWSYAAVLTALDAATTGRYPSALPPMD